MKMPLFRKTVAAMIAAVAASAILPAAASTFTVGGSGNTFTVSRSGAGVAAAETVRYRTVPLSAFPGQHYTEKSGTLVFAPGQPSTNITVSAATLSDGAYMYQTNVVRTYRFEILDEGGFPITNATRDVSTGLRQFKADKVSKSVTDLVTFSGGNFSSGMPSGKYLDVAFTPPVSYVETSGTLAGYVLIDDSYDYAQKPAMVSTAGLINSTGAQADYLAALDYKIYATVCFTEKERDDGYQYLQIVAGTSSASYDGADPNGQVNDPANSVYKVCFELADGSNAEGKAFFPHRGTDTTEFSLSTGKLWQQKYKDGYAAGSSGSVVLPVTTASITTRFDAGGDNDDTWGYKDFFVRMALVDNGQPTLYNNSTAAISVSPGPYSKGNAFYISVPFNEIVFSSGVKTISTTWGSADYCSGDGSNVITFKGTITADAGTVLSITGGTCNFRDFFDNYFQGSLNKTFNGKTVSASHAYPITYDLGGGTLPANAPTNYTYDAAVSLAQPTRTGYTFDGWTGSNGSAMQKFVTIYSGSYGPRSYVAHWTPITYTISYDLAGGALLDGESNPETYAVTNAAFTLVTPVRTGYAFAGWTGTDLGGPTNEVTVAAGSTGDRSYAAHWALITYTNTYDLAGGALPAGAANPETYAVTNAAFTLANPVRTGYAFAGWTGTDLVGPTNEVTVAAGSTGDRSYVATWEANAYRVRFNDNDGSGATRDQEFIYDEPQSLDPAIARTGYDFAGWTGNADGSGDFYFGGQVVSNLTAEADGTVDLYAQWVGHSYIVRFDGNAADAVGCTDEMGMTYDVPDNLVSNAFTRIGYDFAGWSTNANGAVVYADGASVSNLTAVNYGSVMLYAQWTAHSYTVHFDPGGGEGSMPDQSFTYDTPQALSSNAFTRTGYAFIGWSVAGTTYPDGATVLNLTNAQDAVVSLVAKWGIPVPYIDADGTERICADYTVLTNAAGGVAYGGGSGWYVVTNAVTISGRLGFFSDTAHLILCDGATLAVTNANGNAIEARNLTIYGQTNGTGTVTAEGTSDNGIYANYAVTINGGTVTATGHEKGIAAYRDVTINGGTVTATGGDGIYAKSGDVTINGGTVTANGYGHGIYAVNGSVTLGWTNPTDSITASSYKAGGNGVSVKSDQRLTDGSNIYGSGYNLSPTALAGKTLRPAYSISLPEGVVADGVVTQNGTTAYAIAGTNVTLSAAAPGYVLGSVTVNGVPLAPVDGTYTFTASDASITVTATVCIPIPYIDADGTEQMCDSYTVLTNAAGGVGYGTDGEENWYVVTNAITISGRLGFSDTAHLILCDGATLAVTNANDYAIYAGDLTIYGQTNGTGTVTANGGDGIYAFNGSVTINGGTVTATGRIYGIYAANGSVTLGWTNPTDSITASRYGGGGVNVKSDQRFTDGSNIYINHISDPSDLAGKTLRPAYSITLPEGVVAGGVVTQNGTTAYAMPGTNVTLNAAPGYYGIGNVTVDGVPLEPVAGVYSFAASADVTIAATVTPIAYSVRFDANGGEGSMPDQSFTYGEPQALSSNAFTRTGYAFIGWSVAGTTYPDGATVLNLTNAQDAVVSLVAKWGIPVPYIDADGTERICADYTVLTNAAGGVTYGANGATAWYVVTNAVTISGWLGFSGTAHLILCDGATLAVTNANGRAIEARNHLTIYGQTNGTGTVTATGGNGIFAGGSVTINGGTVTANGKDDYGISASGYVTINGGTVTATGNNYGIWAYSSVTINGGTVTATCSTGGYGIFAHNDITLGWTNPTDSITASSYRGVVVVKSDQRLTDGSAIYKAQIPSLFDLAGKTLRPAYSITLPEGVVAGGVVRQDGTTAYAIAGTNVTLNAAPGYYGIGNVTVDGVSLEPVAGVYSFAASADVTIAATVTPVTYVVRFAAAGGEGSMPDQSFTYGEPQALSSNAFTRTGYAFAGWSVDGAIYTDGATVLNLTNAQDAVVSLVAKWGIPYIDADGTERLCADYTVLTNAAGGVAYGANGATAWYVVTNAVTISGQLRFDDYAAHLILCDGATLAVTNANDRAIEAGNLFIYGQTNGTGTATANGGGGIYAHVSVTINGGTVTANGYGNGIYARGSVTINGGTVTATCSTGGYGICAHDDITLGWTNPTDSITASSYYAGNGSVRVKTDQRLTDGSAIYTDYLGTHPTTLKGKTLRPAYSITLPEGVVAGGVVRQDGTTVYAIAGDIVTLSAATPGYAIGTVTVNGVPLEPVAGTYSFTASADVTIAATVTPVTYIVRFDAGADGVTGSMPDQSFTYGEPQALTANAFTRAGYTFAGWLRADGAIYPDGADVDRLYVRYIVRYADNKEDTWKRFDRMPYPGKANDDYHIGDGALQNTENGNGLNLYTGFENSAWNPDEPATAELISQNSAWFDEHDARNGVSMKLIEDFPNFYKEPVVVAQDGVVTLTAIWHPPVPYIDADGTERLCTDYTVLTDATDDVAYGEWGEESWYVVTNAVTISGKLFFRDNTAHLILCDGATLTVTNTNKNSEAIGGSGLTIYGQANGTGAVVANGDCGIAVAGSVTINGGTVTATGRQYGIAAGRDVTINGGTVTATCSIGGYGIFAQKGTITLGWTNPTDSITASSYYAGNGSVRVKTDQRLTDGSAIYKDTDNLGSSPTAIAGKTLRPYIYTPTYPAYLGLPADPADDTEGDAVIRANYDAWALRYGYDALGAYEAAFLLNVAPWATPIELRIAGIEVVEGGARVRVTCRAGLSAEALAEAGASAEAGAVDLSQINGVISVSAGDDLGALAPKAVSGITYSAGEATIFVPASAGRFVKAVIGLTAPEE